MKVIDLIEKSRHHEKSATSQKGLSKTNGKFSAGETIEFWSGYNGDIRYRAQIAGVEGDDIYLIWNCYWSPIRDDQKSEIKKINN